MLTDHICRLEEETELLNRKIPKAKRRLESVLGTFENRQVPRLTSSSKWVGETDYFETSPKRSKVSGSASETPAKTARAPSHLQQIDNQVARNPHLLLILYNNCVFIAHYMVWL